MSKYHPQKHKKRKGEDTMKHMYIKNWKRRQEAPLKHPAQRELTWKVPNNKRIARYVGTAEMQYSIKHSHLNLFTGDVDHVTLEDAYDLCA